MMAAFYSALRAVLSVLIATTLSLQHPSRADEPSQSRRDSTETVSLDGTLSHAFRDAANRASPGLVTVYSMRGPRMTPQWRRREAARQGQRFDMGDSLLARSQSGSFTDDQGSGIVIDSKGLILTCNHLVSAADAILVVLPDGRSFEPVEAFGDPDTDVATIRIECADELDEVPLGDSDDMQVGDWVVTLANPFELKESMSVGVVSAANRWLPGTHHPLIQYDASTNPGSSGGALLNLRGEVIGIITGSFGQSDRFQGIGMAVPVNVAKRAIERIREPGEAERTYLGCQTKALSPAVAEKLKLPVAGGLYVEDVEEGSPAEKAGFKEGDIITRFGGQPVDGEFDLESFLAKQVPSVTSSFTLFRKGESIDVKVDLGGQSDRNVAAQQLAQQSRSPSSQYFDKHLGLGLDNLDDRVALELGFPEKTAGVLVSDVEIGGKAYKEGIAAGMIVRRIDNQAITDLEGYKRTQSRDSVDKPLLMLIQTDDGKHLVVFEDI